MKYNGVSPSRKRITVAGDDSQLVGCMSVSSFWLIANDVVKNLVIIALVLQSQSSLVILAIKTTSVVGRCSDKLIGSEL